MFPCLFPLKTKAKLPDLISKALGDLALHFLPGLTSGSSTGFSHSFKAPDSFLLRKTSGPSRMLYPLIEVPPHMCTRVCIQATHMHSCSHLHMHSHIHTSSSPKSSAQTSLPVSPKHPPFPTAPQTISHLLLFTLIAASIFLYVFIQVYICIYKCL